MRRLKANDVSILPTSTIAHVVDLPTFTYPSPYIKTKSTGDGKAWEDHQEDFRGRKALQLRGAIKKLVKKVGRTGARKVLDNKHSVTLSEGFLQAIVYGDYFPMKHESWRFLTSDEIWTILVDGFGATTGKMDEIRAEPLVGANRFEELKNKRSAWSAHLSARMETLGTTSSPSARQDDCSAAWRFAEMPIMTASYSGEQRQGS